MRADWSFGGSESQCYVGDPCSIIRALVPQAPPRLKIVLMLIADGFLVVRLAASFLDRCRERAGHGRAVPCLAVIAPPMNGGGCRLFAQRNLSAIYIRFEVESPSLSIDDGEFPIFLRALNGCMQ
jgi:hypothetical protein